MAELHRLAVALLAADEARAEEGVVRWLRRVLWSMTAMHTRRESSA
ncbi:MAG: hypothetical protein M5U28_06930 [Sandaracinaceae bacterium]|nr:hypothetical protein [Sandaracinaceae bacterium]